jgi:hypothetical protein
MRIYTRIKALPLILLIALGIITVSNFGLPFVPNNSAIAQQEANSLQDGLLSLQNATGAPTLLNSTDPLILTPEEQYTGPPREVTEPGVPNATLLQMDKLKAQNNTELLAEELEKAKENFTSDQPLTPQSLQSTIPEVPIDSLFPPENDTTTTTGATTTMNSTTPAAVIGNITSVIGSTVQNYASFKGLDSEVSGRWRPSDAALAVGPTHVIEMVNLQGAIFSRQGDVIDIFSVRDFFEIENNHRTADPKVLFDNGSNKWFASLMDLSSNSVHLAVSSSEDALERWSVYKFPFSNCPDQPIIGVSSDKLAISVNTFTNNCQRPNSYSGVQYTIVNKTDLVEGNPLPSFVQSIPNTRVFSLHPLDHQEPLSESTIHMVSVGSSSSSSVLLLSLDGTVQNLQSDISFLPIRLTRAPPDAQQNSTLRMVETNDARVLDAEGYNRRIWITFNDSCIPPNDASIRACIRLIELDAINKQVLQDFNIGRTNSYLFFPSLSVSGNGSVVGIIYQSSNKTTYPSLWFSVHDKANGPHTVQQPIPLQIGPSPVGTDRKGDYQTAIADPYYRGHVWVVGEYHPLPSLPPPNWDTVIAVFRTGT